MKKFGKRNEDDKQVRAEQFKLQVLYSPFVAQNKISSYLFDPKVCEIVDISKIEYDGKVMIKISFTRDMTLNNKTYPTSCYIIVDQDNGWIMREQESCITDLKLGPDKKAPGPSCRSTKIEYQKLADGNLAPKRVLIQTGPASTSYEFDLFEFTKINDSELTLASIGLPELTQTVVNKNPDYRVGDYRVGIAISPETSVM